MPTAARYLGRPYFSPTDRSSTVQRAFQDLMNLMDNNERVFEIVEPRIVANNPI
jgi:hypothetical protein